MKLREFEKFIDEFKIKDLSFFDEYIISRYKLTGAKLIDNIDDYGRKIEQVDFYIGGEFISNKEVFLRKFKLKCFL